MSRQRRAPAVMAGGLLDAVRQRLPAEPAELQEAFGPTHGQARRVPLAGLAPDTFYWFEESVARAFMDAALDLSRQHSSGALTLCYPLPGEFRGHRHLLQHLAARFESIRVLAVDRPGRPVGLAGRVRFDPIAGNPLQHYRLVLCEGVRPLLFVARAMDRAKGAPRYLGFFSHEPELIEDMAESVEQLLHGLGTRLVAFHRLELLQRSTLQVGRELEDYARRLDNAVRRARRRPDLLTPARFQRILGQAIAKLEELKGIPAHALQVLEKPKP